VNWEIVRRWIWLKAETFAVDSAIQRQGNEETMNNINISPQKQKLIVYIILTIATLAVFWQINGYEFINFDDQVYVIENSHIQSGITLDGLRWAFSTRYADLWNPLIWLSFMFDYQLHGLNAGGYH